MNFVPAHAYHFCLNLPAAFTQPGARLLVEPCTEDKKKGLYVLLRRSQAGRGRDFSQPRLCISENVSFPQIRRLESNGEEKKLLALRIPSKLLINGNFVGMLTTGSAELDKVLLDGSG